MPPPQRQKPDKSLEQIVEEVGLYPIQAFEFVQHGLGYTVEKIHGNAKDPDANRHISGRDLCDGLREYALLKWGLMARTVLNRWNIRRTLDFGRMVFALVEHGHMSKTEEDTIEDFRDVYDFASAFDGGYRIESKV